MRGLLLALGLGMLLALGATPHYYVPTVPTDYQLPTLPEGN